MSRKLEIATEIDEVVLRKLLTPVDHEAFKNLVIENRHHLIRYCPGVVRGIPQLIKGNYTDRSDRFVIANGRLIMGSVALSECENPKETEIGYWLGEKFIGNGYATAAVRALSRYALENYTSIEARIAESNHRSIGVIERVGYRRMGKIAGTGMITFEFNEQIHRDSQDTLKAS